MSDIMESMVPLDVATHDDLKKALAEMQDRLDIVETNGAAAVQENKTLFDDVQRLSNENATLRDQLGNWQKVCSEQGNHINILIKALGKHVL